MATKDESTPKPEYQHRIYKVQTVQAIRVSLYNYDFDFKNEVTFPKKPDGTPDETAPKQKIGIVYDLDTRKYPPLKRQDSKKPGVMGPLVPDKNAIDDKGNKIESVLPMIINKLQYDPHRTSGPIIQVIGIENV